MLTTRTNDFQTEERALLDEVENNAKFNDILLKVYDLNDGFRDHYKTIKAERRTTAIKKLTVYGLKVVGSEVAGCECLRSNYKTTVVECYKCHGRGWAKARSQTVMSRHDKAYLIKDIKDSYHYYYHMFIRFIGVEPRLARELDFLKQSLIALSQKGTVSQSKIWEIETDLETICYKNKKTFRVLKLPMCEFISACGDFRRCLQDILKAQRKSKEDVRAWIQRQDQPDRQDGQERIKHARRDYEPKESSRKRHKGSDKSSARKRRKPSTAAGALKRAAEHFQEVQTAAQVPQQPGAGEQNS